jgi:hypothetical protein
MLRLDIVKHGLAPSRHQDAVPELKEFESEGKPNACGTTCDQDGTICKSHWWSLPLSDERQKTPTLVCCRSHDVREGLEESGERAKTVGSVFAMSRRDQTNHLF